VLLRQKGSLRRSSGSGCSLASAVCGIPQVDVFTSSTNGTELKDNATDRFHTIGWYSHNHTCCHAQPTKIRKKVIQLPKKLQLINTWIEVQDPLASTSNETKVKRDFASIDL
jgi:hypothetical protein